MSAGGADFPDVEAMIMPSPVDVPSMEEPGGETFMVPVERRRRGGGHGRPRAPATSGQCCVWLVAAEAGQDRSGSSSPVRDAQPLPRQLAGLALVSWTFFNAREAPERIAISGPVAGAQGRGAAPWGFVDYESREVWRLERPLALGAALPLHFPTSHLHLEQLANDCCLRGVPTTISALLGERNDLQRGGVLLLPPATMDAVFAQVPPYLLKRCPLHARFNPRSLVLNAPSKSAVQRWKRDARLQLRRHIPHAALKRQRQQVPTADDAVLHVPTKQARTRQYGLGIWRPGLAVQQNRCNPVKLIHAISLSTKLRSVHVLSEALLDAAYFDADSDDDDEIDRDTSRDPGHTVLAQARQRLDIVGMNIQRRIFHQEMSEDAIEGIACFSDASPVTGEEIQGMAVDILKRDGTVRHVVLPGSSLRFGEADAINKGSWGSEP